MPDRLFALCVDSAGVLVDNHRIRKAVSQVDILHKQGYLVVLVHRAPQLLRQRGGVGGGDRHLDRLPGKGGQWVAVALVGADEVAGVGAAGIFKELAAAAVLFLMLHYNRWYK